MMGSTLRGELRRTAKMLVDLSMDQGIYYAVALLHDASYDLGRIKALLPILQNTPNAIKKEAA